MFPLGQISATPGALQLLDRTDTEVGALLRRHQSGDWGTVDAEDVRANNDAVINGARILSAYELGTDKTKIWVITEADRRVSTILLPSEY